jgi:capsular polysaccharide biosynthesis protein/Mrp family chromosome partitioning ATPase
VNGGNYDRASIAEDSGRDGGSEGGRTPLLAYLGAVRAHWLLVVAVALTTVVATAGWLALRKEPRYEATANLLVSPLPDDDATLIGLPLVRAVGVDSARAVKTAASLVNSPQAAERAAQALGTSASAVERAIDVVPAQDSNIIDVTAETTDAENAAEIANAYADAALSVRTSELRPLVRSEIQRLRAQLTTIPDSGSPAAETIGVRLAGLETIRDGRDPTLSIARRAEPPDAAAGPASSVVIAVAVPGGVALGIVVAVLMEMLVPRRITDEGHLRDVWALPVLARVPWVPSRIRRESALDLGRERFRSLRAQLEVDGSGAPGRAGLATRDASGIVVVVSSPTRGDGRTTTALMLARAVAAAGQSAIVLDLDLANPMVEELVGPERGETRALGSPALGFELELQTVPGTPEPLAIAAPTDGTWAQHADALLESLPELLSALRGEAEWVIVDTAPVGTLAAAQEVLRGADRQLIVVRPGNSRQADLIELREVSEREVAAPRGYVLIGHREPARERGRRRRRRRPAVSAADR